MEAIMISMSNVGPLLYVCVFFALLGWTLRVCAADARRRGKSPLLVIILIFLSFPLGLIVWLLLRPEPIDRDKGFRLEDHRVQ
jgi:hypothetical protein